MKINVEAAEAKKSAENAAVSIKINFEAAEAKMSAENAAAATAMKINVETAEVMKTAKSPSAVTFQSRMKSPTKVKTLDKTNRSPQFQTANSFVQ